MTRSILPAVLATLFAAGAAAQAPAPADTVVGAFHLRRPAADSAAGPLAIVFPEGERGDGALAWTCAEGGGLAMAVRLVQWGAPRKVLVAFDGGAPDTVRLREVNGVLGMVDVRDAARLAGRARTARRATLRPVRPLEPARPGSPASFRYDLDGAAAALDRLACGAVAAGRGPHTSYITLKGAAWTPWLDLYGGLSDDEPQSSPSLTNRAEFGRALERGYPPDLRDAGVEGYVEVLARVLPDGRVDSASVRARRSIHSAFDSIAMAVMRRARFLPGRLYGRPVSLWVTQPITFATAENTPAEPRRGTRPRRRRRASRRPPRS